MVYSHGTPFIMRGDDMPSDEELIRLTRKVDTHISDYKDHVNETEIRYMKQNEQYENNMTAIAALTESTQGVVDAWQAAAFFQKFVKWLSGFAILGAIIAWAADRLPKG